MEVIAIGTGVPAEVSEVRWVRLSEDHDALANQWLLVTESPEPIAFVGFETSPPDRIGQGGVADPSRTWAGFVTDDPRLVGAIVGYLHGLADREVPPVPDGQGTAQSTMLLIATDDGVDPAYTVCAGPVWKRPGARMRRWSCTTGRLSRTWSTRTSPGRGHPRTTVRPGRRFLTPMS